MGANACSFSRVGVLKGLLDKRSGVSDWTIHDISRTVATGMADIGIQPHIIEAVLNHISGHKGGVAGIYNRSSYAAEKPAALVRWDAHVASVVGGAIMTEAVTRYKNCVRVTREFVQAPKRPTAPA